MKENTKRIQHDHSADGIDRRGFLECMAWAGTGMIWSIAGGLLNSQILLARAQGSGDIGQDFHFVQISDTHIGFNKEANKDVAGTLKECIARINALPKAPDFILHTGDLTHLSEAEEFDTLDQLLKGVKTSEIIYVPGEHDVIGDNGKRFRERFGKDTAGQGWRSFDHRGIHFIGLVNVMDIREGGLGVLGREQIDWIEKDLKNKSSDTPIVVFAHMPLWNLYPQWGWGTDDAAEALTHLKRFGSVTVLNGHIHQVMKKVEGKVTFHTAMSTAFPQPEPGKAPKPGPMKVASGELRNYLGITEATFIRNAHSLAIVDSKLA
jgi:3',5'-cyclic AMP phosphodiesterase CpdA